MLSTGEISALGGNFLGSVAFEAFSLPTGKRIAILSRVAGLKSIDLIGLGDLGHVTAIADALYDDLSIDVGEDEAAAAMGDLLYFVSEVPKG